MHQTESTFYVARRVTSVAVILMLFLGPTTLVTAYSSFVPKLPNGLECARNGSPWPAVGHGTATSGSKGNVNSFGNAFRAAGFQWTPALCKEDTDGDGFSNGVELGDPDCVWVLGAVPSRTTGISHPGYADSTPELSPKAPEL